MRRRTEVSAAPEKGKGRALLWMRFIMELHLLHSRPSCSKGEDGTSVSLLAAALGLLDKQLDLNSNSDAERIAKQQPEGSRFDK